MKVGNPDSLGSAELDVTELTPTEPNGRTIILVHGSLHTGICYLATPDGRDGWAQIFAHFGYRVLVPHWLSSRDDRDKKKRPTSGELVCNALGALIDSIEGPIDLLVHSMSGPYGFRLVETHGHRIARLVAVAPGPPGNIQPTLEGVVENHDTVLASECHRRTVPHDAWVAPTADSIERFTHSIRFPQQNLDNYLATLVDVHSRMIIERLNVNGAQLYIHDTDPFTEKPILVITGSDDTLHPREVDGQIANWLADLGASVNFCFLPDVGIHGNGHMLMIEDNSDAIAEMIDHWIRNPESAMTSQDLGDHAHSSPEPVAHQLQPEVLESTKQRCE